MMLPAEVHRGPGHLDVLVHPAVLALPPPVAEEPQHPDGKDPAEADQPPLKGHAPPAIDPIDLRRQPRQPRADLRRQLRGQILVRIQAQHPVRIAVELRQRPVELGGVVHPGPLHHPRPVRLGNGQRLVRGEAVGHQHLVRHAVQARQAARQMPGLVQRQDNRDQLQWGRAARGRVTMWKG